MSPAVRVATTEAAPSAPVSRANARDSLNSADNDYILRVRDLKTYFFTYDGVVRALDGVTFSIRRGETMGLVGETGCGKSVTAFSITRLVSDPPGRIISGEIWFKGANLLWNLEREARIKPIKGTVRAKVRRRHRVIKQAQVRLSAVRGSEISMIFQEPMSALNPVFSITHQLGESLELQKLPAIIDILFKARPNLRSYLTGLDRITKAATSGDPTALEEACRALAEEAKTPELAPALRTAAANASGASREALTEALEKVYQTVALKARIEAILTAAREPGQPRLRAACRAFSQVLGVPSVETEAYYLFRNVTRDPERNLGALSKTLRRLTLSAPQRSYLRHRLRLAELFEKRRQLSLREMKEGRSYSRLVSGLRLRSWRESLQWFWLSLPIYRRYTQAPLRQEIFWETVRMLEGVGIANPVQVARGFPHELSGGMIQRVMIAMALAPEPSLLIADEPTTALDVTIQAQILDLMRDLKHRIGTAILLITHDLGVVAEVCDRVCVMYAGNIVEVAPVRDLFTKPLHPYSQGLLASIPRMDDPNKKLESIPGSVPNLIYPPGGCRFHPRCAFAMEKCKTQKPPTTLEGPGHVVACWLYSGKEVKEY